MLDGGRAPWRLLVPVISQQFFCCSESILKSHEALGIEVGATKIDYLRACRFAFFNQPPKQEGHAAQIMKPLIGAAILVNYG